MSDSKTGGKERETPPPKRGCEIAEIPDLELGDVIRTHHLGRQDPRKLTVVQEGHDQEADTLGWAGTGGRYVLEGYGTNYYLTTTKSLTGSWQRVDLVYKTRPEGETVTDIDIISRAGGDNSPYLHTGDDQ